MTRRDWLQTVAIGVPLLLSAEPERPLFFTPQEFALLDALTDLIIPTDSHSPGAHAAGVAPYIDRVTAQAFPGEAKTSWTNGLKKVNEEAGGSFVSLDRSKQIALLQAMDKRNDSFFGQLKETTAFAYYSSNIGIHQETCYLGNVLLDKFVGYAV